MRNALSLPTRQLAMLGLSMILATLAGCGGTPVKKPEPKHETSSSVTPTHTLEGSYRLPPSQYAAQFAAAESALSHFDWMSANVALAPLTEPRVDDEEETHPTLQPEPVSGPTSGLSAASQPSLPSLSADDEIYLSYLNARIAYVRGRQQSASKQLAAIDSATIHPALSYRIQNFQRHMLGLEGHYLQAAKLGASVLEGAPASDHNAIKRALWRDLERCDAPTLQQASSQSSDPQWRAWLELALISRDDLTTLTTKLQQWQEQNLSHPANAPLPGGMGFLLDNTTPDTVALILPLSGRLAAAGKAVRDGYVASYLSARALGKAPQQLLVLDSDNYGSALEAYNDAVAQGARLVVGPLSKEAVGQLALQTERPIPILALNRIDQPVTAGTSALVQMALAPEDEASRIAEQAYGQGARRALILRPAGHWGDKMEAALKQRWQSLGGTIASSISYKGRDDYSPAVKNGMGLESSEQRRTRVRDMLATNVEFTPRRRQDLDAIFMLSRNGPEARSVKPLLAFHYAGALPIYATSSIYSGSPDNRDRDLDGINLVEMPWLLDGSSDLKNTLEAGNTNSSQLTRLNALGVDAYELQSRFVQLQGGPDALLRGSTGLLSMNPQLQIHRELSPATFDGGELTPL